MVGEVGAALGPLTGAFRSSRCWAPSLMWFSYASRYWTYFLGTRALPPTERSSRHFLATPGHSLHVPRREELTKSLAGLRVQALHRQRDLMHAGGYRTQFWKTKAAKSVSVGQTCERRLRLGSISVCFFN